MAPPAVGSSDHIKLVTVYGLALHQGFGYSGGSFHDAAGSHIAVAITFEVVDGKYVLKGVLDTAGRLLLCSGYSG